MRFKIDATWAQLPKPGKRDVAAISMTLGERVLTRLLEVGANQPRDFVRASAVSLALWLADNWWRLRWEPIPDYQAITADWRLRHELTSASGGTAWPPLMIYGVGARVVVAPISGLLETGEPMPVEYLPIPVSLMSGRIFEDGVDRFFSTVTEMCAHVQDGAALAALVRQIQDERQDPEVAAWRRLEAQLGYDPDAAPETVIESLSELEERVGPEAIEEAAIGSPGAQAPQVLEQAIEATRASDVKVNLEVAAAAAVPCEQVDLTRPIWMVAEDAAGRLRNAMGRSAGPFLNRALGDALQVSWDRVRHAPPTARNLPYGARLREERTAEHVALQTRTPHDRRFELARVLGDAVWTSSAHFGVISRGKTDRQKFQRAFAQSLLCPFEDLRHYVNLSGPTEDQIEAAARRYHVHRSVVRTLLVNKGFLARETLGEQLEAA